MDTAATANPSSRKIVSTEPRTAKPGMDRSNEGLELAMPDWMSGRPRGTGNIAAEADAQEKKGRSMKLLPLGFSPEYYFLGGAITSFAALATRNLTTVLALILMASPVCGLRPMRAFRSAFTRRPMPGMMKTPFFLVSLIAVSASRSRKAADCLLVISSFSARCRVRAVLVSPVAMCCSPSDVCCLGFRRSAPSHKGSKKPSSVPHGGSATEATFARNPCMHAGSYRTLSFKTMRPGGGQSQWKNDGFPQFSQVFVPKTPFLG